MRIKSLGNLGQLVCDQRKQRGWSRTQLAEKVGVSRLWISQLENGKETVEFGLVLKTIRALELPLDVSKLMKNPFPRGLAMTVRLPLYDGVLGQGWTRATTHLTGPRRGNTRATRRW